MAVADWIDIDADRYPEFWENLSLKIRAMTGHRCCYPGCSQRATSTHHIVCGWQDEAGVWQRYHYRENGRLYLPGLHLVPLCDHHHTDRDSLDCVHHPSHWNKGTRANQFRDARNTKEMHLLLMQGWHEKLLPKYRSS